MNKKKIEMFFKNSNLLFCIANKNGYFTQLNPSWSKTLGWSQTELLSKPFIEFVHPEDKDKTTVEAKKLDGNNPSVNFLNRYLAKDGSVVHLSWNAQVIEDDIYCIVQNISPEIKEKQALEKTSQAAKIGSWEVDLIKNKMNWSLETWKIHGFEKKIDKEFSVSEGIDFYHPNYRDLVKTTVDNAIKNGQGWDFEAQIITIKGQPKWVRTIGFVEFNPDSTPIRLYGTFQDIHEKKMEEQNLKKRKSLLHLCLKNAAMGTFRFNFENSCFHFSEIMSEYLFLDWTNQCISKEIFKDRIHPNDVHKCANALKTIKEEGHFPKVILRLRSLKNRWEYFSFEGGLLDKESSEVVGVVKNITESVEKEAQIEKQKMQLIQSSKMSTLGEMAGGIAHEINNPLAILINIMQVQKPLLDKISDSDIKNKIYKNLELGEKTVKRISSIISGLKDFAKDGKSVPLERHSLISVIEESLSFYKTKIKNENISLKIDVPDTLFIHCNKTYMSQILTNLVSNSIDFTQNSENKNISIRAKKVKNQVLIFYKDTGPGVHKEIQSKIFEPFFSTKDHGKGTGLGLSICKGLMESQGGSIKLSESHSSEFLLKLKSA